MEPMEMAETAVVAAKVKAVAKVAEEAVAWVEAVAAPTAAEAEVVVAATVEPKAGSKDLAAQVGMGMILDEAPRQDAPGMCVVSGALRRRRWQLGNSTSLACASLAQVATGVEEELVVVRAATAGMVVWAVTPQQNSRLPTRQRRTPRLLRGRLPALFSLRCEPRRAQSVWALASMCLPRIAPCPPPRTPSILQCVQQVERN